MTPELQTKIYEKYPEIFKDKDASPNTSCMGFGLDVADGWYTLIDNLCNFLMRGVRSDQYMLDIYKQRNDQAKIIEYQNKVDAALAILPVASQVKEKFGTLRFYVNSASSEDYAAITFAEMMSGSICETCGNLGKIRTDKPWVRTLCDVHAQEK